MQDFTVLPLLTFAVATRWPRASAASRTGRIALDIGGAAAIFCGNIMGFLFLVVAPYLIAARLLAERRVVPTPPTPGHGRLPSRSLQRSRSCSGSSSSKGSSPCSRGGRAR